MPSTHDNGKLSGAAYGDSSKLPPGWKELPYFEYDRPLNGSGYEGHVYYNELTKEIVIAHRGTELFKDPIESIPIIPGTKDGGDLLSNVKIVVYNLLGFEPDQLREARFFTDQVKWRIQNDPNFKDYNVSHTGHSLGGYLATVVGAENGQPAEVFDPPGSKDYLDAALQDGRISQQQYDDAVKNTTTHISDGSIVDNYQDDSNYLGNVNKVNIGDGYNALSKHFIDNIIDNIEKHPEKYNKFNNASSSFKNSTDSNAFTRIDGILAQIAAGIAQVRQNLN